MDYSCENCVYAKKTMYEEPCRSCKFEDGEWGNWTPNNRDSKLERLEKLCKEHDCCADCPVTDKDDTEYLCARFGRHELSDVSIDTLLEILENESDGIKTAEVGTKTELGTKDDVGTHIGAVYVDNEEDAKVELHREICEEIHKLYEIKNHDYGDSFGKGFREYGLIMPVIRLEDKLNRLKQLVNREGLVKDESVDDTLIDLANYAIMTVLERREKE